MLKFLTNLTLLCWNQSTFTKAFYYHNKYFNKWNTPPPLPKAQGGKLVNTLLLLIDGTCPDGTGPVTTCFDRPCGVERSPCTSYPDAVCVDNYCGGCNTDWYLDGELVDCNDSELIDPLECSSPVTACCVWVVILITYDIQHQGHESRLSLSHGWCFVVLLRSTDVMVCVLD